MRIIGLDPSFGGFAVCAWDGGNVELTTLKSETEGQTWEQRRSRYVKFAAEVCRAVKATDQPIFIEGYSFSSKNSRAHGTGEFGAILRLKLSQQFQVPIYEVTPTELKKFVIGKGVAQKPEMVSAVTLKLQRPVADDNQADAFGLMWIGRCVLGVENPGNAKRREIVDQILKRHAAQPTQKKRRKPA